MLSEEACDSRFYRWHCVCVCGGGEVLVITQELCWASDLESAVGARASLDGLHHGKEMSKQWHWLGCEQE